MVEIFIIGGALTLIVFSFTLAQSREYLFSKMLIWLVIMGFFAFCMSAYTEYQDLLEKAEKYEQMKEEHNPPAQEETTDGDQFEEPSGFDMDSLLKLPSQN